MLTTRGAVVWLGAGGSRTVVVAVVRVRLWSETARGRWFGFTQRGSSSCTGHFLSASVSSEMRRECTFAAGPAQARHIHHVVSWVRTSRCSPALWAQTVRTDQAWGASSAPAVQPQAVAPPDSFSLPAASLTAGSLLLRSGSGSCLPSCHLVMHADSTGSLVPLASTQQDKHKRDIRN